MLLAVLVILLAIVVLILLINVAVRGIVAVITIAGLILAGALHTVAWGLRHPLAAAPFVVVTVYVAVQLHLNHQL